MPIYTPGNPFAPPSAHSGDEDPETTQTPADDLPSQEEATETGARTPLIPTKDASRPPGSIGVILPARDLAAEEPDLLRPGMAPVWFDVVGLDRRDRSAWSTIRTLTYDTPRGARAAAVAAMEPDDREEWDYRWHLWPLEFYGDVTTEHAIVMERVFCGMGKDADGSPTFPPTMAEAAELTRAKDAVGRAAEAVLRDGGVSRELMDAWMDRVMEFSAAISASHRLQSKAKKFKHPETGLNWFQYTSGKSTVSLADRAVTAEREWLESRAGKSTAMTSAPPWITLDAEPASPRSAVIGEDLLWGGTAMVLPSGTFIVGDLLEARLTGGQWQGKDVARGPAVLIDCLGSHDGLTEDLAAMAVAHSEEFRVASYMSAPEGAPVHERDYASELAAGIPAGALIVVNDSTLMASSGISEMTVEAISWLRGWQRVAELAEAAAVVVVHGPTKSDPHQPRGHATLAAWPGTVWTIAGSVRNTDDPEALLAKAVADMPGKPHSHYAGVLGLSPTTIARASGALQRKKLISMEPGPRKAKLLYPKA